METPAPPPPTNTTTVKTETPDSNSLPLTTKFPTHHKPLHHHHPPPPPVASYKECLKNHAAAMGGHATDGCGEYMPSPTSSTNHPTSLKCAVCGCHRNFHRRDPHETVFPFINYLIEYQPHHRHHPLPPPIAGSPQNPPSPPHTALALSTVFPYPAADKASGKKRLRTKFTENQKEKMHEFAERVEWKMGNCNEDTFMAFCNEIGVPRNVFKVWMHNNKTKTVTTSQL